MGSQVRYFYQILPSDVSIMFFVVYRVCFLLMFLRCGIALTLNKLSQYLDEAQVTPLFLFFVPDALNDRHPEVRRCMLDAALSALNTHGKVMVCRCLF